MSLATLAVPTVEGVAVDAVGAAGQGRAALGELLGQSVGGLHLLGGTGPDGGRPGRVAFGVGLALDRRRRETHPAGVEPDEIEPGVDVLGQPVGGDDAGVLHPRSAGSTRVGDHRPDPVRLVGRRFPQHLQGDRRPGRVVVGQRHGQVRALQRRGPVQLGLLGGGQVRAGSPVQGLRVERLQSGRHRADVRRRRRSRGRGAASAGADGRYAGHRVRAGSERQADQHEDGGEAPGSQGHPTIMP